MLSVIDIDICRFKPQILSNYVKVAAAPIIFKHCAIKSFKMALFDAKNDTQHNDS
jgi:hypothetical protein